MYELNPNKRKKMHLHTGFGCVEIGADHVKVNRNK